MKTFAVTAFGILMAFVLLLPAPALSQETLLIGQAVTLSGPSASWGVGQMRFLEMLEEEYNAKGGLNVGGKRYLIKHITYDNKVDMDTTMKAINKLVFEHKVKFIFGGSVGTTCRGAQTITAPNNVMYSFACWGKELLSKDVPLNFRVEFSPWELCDPYFKALKVLYPNAKTIATLSPNDTSGWDGAKGEIAAAQKLGMKAVAEMYYERSQEDFHGVLGKILAQKPDIIGLGASPVGTGGLILKQAYELGYRGPKSWVGGSMPLNVIKVCGVEAAEDIYTGLNWDYFDKFTLPALHKTIKAYMDRYKEGVDYTAIGQYCFMRLAFQTMEKTGNVDDPVKLADAIGSAAPYDSIVGPYMFGSAKFYGGKPRQALHPLVLSCVKKGKMINMSYALPDELREKIGDWKFPQ